MFVLSISSLLVLQHSAYFDTEKCLSYWLKVLLTHNEIAHCSSTGAAVTPSAKYTSQQNLGVIQ